MKLAIIISFVLNVAIVLFMGATPDKCGTLLGPYFHKASPSAVKLPSIHAAVLSSKTSSRLWSKIATEDLPTLISRLQAAGFPTELIRAIIRAQVNTRYGPRLRAIYDPDPSVPYWKKADSRLSGDSGYELYSHLQRERSKLLRDSLLPLGDTAPETTVALSREFGNIPAAKIESIRSINADYEEMQSALRKESGGIILKEDRDKLALLKQEKQADLAAVLTPEELADYQMRSSPITSELRRQMTSFDATPPEFIAIFRAEEQANAQLSGNLASSDNQLRQAVQTTLGDQLHSLLGDARYADYIRETDNEYQQLGQIAARNNLSSETAVAAYNLRRATLAESNRIFDDASLTNDQKRQALQDLAQSTRAQLTASLGPAASASYLSLAARWLNPLDKGTAITLTATPPLVIVNEAGAQTTYFGGMSFHSVPANNKTRK